MDHRRHHPARRVEKLRARLDLKKKRHSADKACTRRNDELPFTSPKIKSRVKWPAVSGRMAGGCQLTLGVYFRAGVRE
jgi:hypothetical protein